VPSDTINKPRFYSAVSFGAVAYSGFTIGLNQLWYADYEKSGFHLFNDWNEWENMDKFAHSFDTYFQSRLIYSGARWTGMNKSSSLWTSIGTALLFQSTIEVLDGFSEEWGFSIPDVAFNLAGGAVFGLQQHFWDEQKIVLKISSFPNDYPDLDIISSTGQLRTLEDRAFELYGSSFAARFVKDYNFQNIWASVNLNAVNLAPEWLPKWLNVAVGIGAENMYGGFENFWESEEGDYRVDLPRYQQYYLALDVDLTRIPTKSPFLKSLFSVLNIIKIPSPALEWNKEEGFRGHWVLF
jgi:hypothetical protein